MYIPTAKDRCPTCGAESGWTVKVAPLEQTFGAVRVLDSSVRLPHCNACNEWLIDSGELARVEARSAAVAIRDTLGKLTGVGMRAVRKALGLTQAQMGKLLHFSVEQVSRWENGNGECKENTQLALLPFLDEIADGKLDDRLLAYMLDHDELRLSSKVRDVVVTRGAA